MRIRHPAVPGTWQVLGSWLMLLLTIYLEDKALQLTTLLSLRNKLPKCKYFATIVLTKQILMKIKTTSTFQ